MSLEALWFIQFEVPKIERRGGGVVVFETGRILGGDSSFYYIGDYSVDNKEIQGRVEVKRHNYMLEAVIPGLEYGAYSYKGVIESDDSIIMVGTPEQLAGTLEGNFLQVTIVCKRICDLP